MNYALKTMLKTICALLVVQGPKHRQNIIDYYKMMYEAAQNEFTEDNKPTLDDFLRECHAEASKE